MPAKCLEPGSVSAEAQPCRDATGKRRLGLRKRRLGRRRKIAPLNAERRNTGDLPQRRHDVNATLPMGNAQRYEDAVRQAAQLHNPWGMHE